MVNPLADIGSDVAPTPSIAQVNFLYKNLFNCNFTKSHIIMLLSLRFWTCFHFFTNFLSQFDSYRKGKEHLTQEKLLVVMVGIVLGNDDIAYCNDPVSLCKKIVKSINLKILRLVMDPNP